MKRASIVSLLDFLTFHDSPQRLVRSPRTRRAGMVRVAAVLLLGVVVSTAASTGAVAPQQPSSLHSRAALGTVRATADTGLAADTALRPTPWDSTGWTGRVVVGEYVTGVFCGGCYNRNKVFEALQHRYSTTVFLPLAYHYQFPIADMTYEAELGRRIDEWYGAGDTTSTTSSVGLFPHDKTKYENEIDGHATDEPYHVTEYPKDWMWRQAMYTNMSQAIDAELHKAPEALLRVQATPHGGAIDTRVTVTSLAPGHPELYVRIVLVEDTVTLVPAKDSEFRAKPIYLMVVRSAAGSARLPLGLPLHGAGTVQYTFQVAQLQRHILSFRTFSGFMEAGGGSSDSANVKIVKQMAMGISGKDPAQWPDSVRELYKAYKFEVEANAGVFPDVRNWRIDPTRLHVVAFVQDARTGDVLQAQMVSVKTGPHGALLQLP